MERIQLKAIEQIHLNGTFFIYWKSLTVIRPVRIQKIAHCTTDTEDAAGTRSQEATDRINLTENMLIINVPLCLRLRKDNMEFISFLAQRLLDMVEILWERTWNVHQDFSESRSDSKSRWRGDVCQRHLKFQSTSVCLYPTRSEADENESQNWTQSDRKQFA